MFVAGDRHDNCLAAATIPPDTPTRIPASVRTIAVPVFVNQTQTYRIEADPYARRRPRISLAYPLPGLPTIAGSFRRRGAQRHSRFRTRRATHLRRADRTHFERRGYGVNEKFRSSITTATRFFLRIRITTFRQQVSGVSR